MDYLSWELSVLSRAVAFQNLSGAAVHVGISQPQLSRIVAKLEDQLGLVLLDRDTKRRSSWTKEALKLAEIYARTHQQFKADVGQLSDQAEPAEIRVGTLEGLSDIASRFCHQLYKESKAQVVELAVLDLSELEEAFLKQNLEFLYTSRTPARAKPRYMEQIGYQSLESHNADSRVQVMSPFEYATQPSKEKRHPSHRSFVSNSLVVRANWVKNHGAAGVLPSAVRAKPSRGKDEVPVLLLAQDHLSAALWDRARKAAIATKPT
jgi:LysR family transcriptional regulator, transcriptional activator for aaeXAB operon